MNNSSSKWGHLACFVAYAIFGFNIIGCKGLASDGLISPVALFCLRSIGAGLLFWLLSLFIPAEKVRRADYPRIFMASVLGFFLTQITFLMAIHDITPMDCSIVSSLSPIYTMFIAAVAIHEPITLKKAGGVALSFAGIIFLILNSVGSGGPATTTSTAVLLMIANGLCFSLYLGIFKPVIQRYSVVTFMKIDYLSLPSHYVAELAFLIVGATFISYFLIPVGQKRIRPTLVSLYSYVQPIIAILISITLGMDVLSWQKVLAMVTVFAGVVIVSYSRSASR